MNQVYFDCNNTQQKEVTFSVMEISSNSPEPALHELTQAPDAKCSTDELNDNNECQDTN
jgi:hypothetical protein